MKRQLIKGAAIILLFLFTFLTPTSDFVYAQQPVASFFYDDQGHVTQQARDTNGDGKMDRWTHYNERGQISTASRMRLFIMRTASPGAKKSLAITTDESISGICLTRMEKSSAKAKIQIERVSQPCGSTIRTASRYGPKNRTVLPA
jgi:hypothetical protein